MKYFFIIITFFFSLTSYCQIINSSEDPIAKFYNGKVKSIELNGGEVEAQLRVLSWESIYNWKVKSKTNKDTIVRKRSAEKINTFFIDFGLTNAKELFKINELNVSEKNGFILGVTFQHAFNKIYVPIKKYTNPHPLDSWTISLKYRKDKFNNYDPINKKESIASPHQLFVEGGYSYYFFNNKPNSKKFSIIPTIFGRLNIIGHNENSLKNYILSNNTEIMDGIIFTDNTEFDGKYGVVTNNKSSQISISAPFIPHKLLLNIKIFKKNIPVNLPVIAPIPYLNWKISELDKPQYNAGIALGILPLSVMGEQTKSDNFGDFYNFNIPSFLTLAVDWTNQNGKGSKPNYFVSGTINID